ncbi:MAG: c-type cytochrome domain-containing protein [Pirellulales bacterium]
MVRFSKSLVCFLGLGLASWSLADDAPVQKITYEDHIKPIFREHCLSCHNTGDKSGGLALDSFGATLEGGSGGKVVQETNVDGSRLYALMAHKASPKMPPEQDRLPDATLDLVKRWIEQGMPENSGSAIKKPKANAAMLAVGASGRPEGPPPMPELALKQPAIYTAKSAAVSALTASPWAPLVAIGGQEQVVLYHSETGQLLGILPFPEGEPQSIRFSRDGQLVLVGGGRHSHSGFAVLYSLKTGERITRVGDELDIVMEADISDDNKLIALAGPQKMVRIYSTDSGERLFEMKKHTDWIYAVKFSPDGVLLATADRSNGLVVWEAQTGRLYLDLVGHKGEIRSLAWRPDSSALISASLDGKIKTWEMVEGKEIKSVDAHGGVMSIAVCNDGTMVSTGKDNKVRIWDPAGNPAGELPPMAENGLEVAITVDGKQIAAGDWLGNVTLWDRANPAKKTSLAANPPTLQMLIASEQARLEQVKTQAISANAAWLAANQQLETVQKQAVAEEQALTQTMATLTNATQQMGTLKSEVDAQAKKMAELEAALAEMKKVQGEKVAQLAATENTVKEMTSKKDALEKQKQATAAAMKPMADAAAQAKAANDAAQAAVQQSSASLELAKADLIKFEEYRAGLAKKDAELKAQLDELLKQVAAADEASKQEKSSVETMTATLAKLQQQLQQLQSQVQEHESKQKEAASMMAAKEKAASELKAKLEQLQGEAAAAAETKALFEKAFKPQ